MELNVQQKKSQLASHLIKVLEALKLNRTANTLRQQAQLTSKPIIHEDVQKIKKATASDPLKQKELINSYFTAYLKKLIRENLWTEALQIFQKELPLFVDDLEPFSLLFASSSEEEHLDIYRVLQQILKESQGLPEKRVSCLQYQSQIWMLEVLGKSILVIDDHSNARVVRDDTVIAERLQLHSTQIYCVAVKDENTFATGSLCKTCKVWSSKLQLLYEMSRHNERITSICFVDSQMASFDRSGEIIVTKEVPNIVRSKNSIPHYKLKGIPYNDVKYISSKKCVLGVGFSENKGRIDLADLQKKKYINKLALNQKIYNVELSLDQKIVFANLSTMCVHAYSISNFELKFTITGYQQHQFLMRMSIGGPKGELLAITSEDGCVYIYNTRKNELSGKIKGLSGKTINCVKWLDQGIFFGCDGGCVEHWITQNPQLNTSGKENPAYNQIVEEFNENEPNSQELQELQ